MPANINTGVLFPLSWGTTVGTTSGPVLPANPTRAGLWFINPTVGVAIAVAPALMNVGLLGIYSGFQPSVAAINGPGSITLQPGDKWLIDSVLCTCAWVGIASGPGGGLTILEH